MIFALISFFLINRLFWLSFQFVMCHQDPVLRFWDLKASWHFLSCKSISNTYSGHVVDFWYFIILYITLWKISHTSVVASLLQFNSPQSSVETNTTLQNTYVQSIISCKILFTKPLTAWCIFNVCFYRTMSYYNEETIFSKEDLQLETVVISNKTLL